MQNTTNYNLKKPESNEFVNVDDINSNMDIIDEQLKNIDDSKVTKINGKSLSTNDYTTAEKEKLATLTNYDDSGLRREISTKADRTYLDTKLTEQKNYTDLTRTYTLTHNRAEATTIKGLTSDVGVGEKSPDNPFSLTGVETNGVTLYSLPSGVCDEYNAETGVLTKRVEKVVLNGNENGWYKSLDHEFANTLTDLGLENTVSKEDNYTGYLMNRFLPWFFTGGQYIKKRGQYRQASQKIYFAVFSDYPIDSGKTLEDFKQWLSQNPVTVLYELATEETIQLTPKTTYQHTLTDLPTGQGIYQCQFIAQADYTEGDVFESYTAKPTGEEQSLPDKAFVKGDIVSITVDTVHKKLGFKIGGSAKTIKIKQYTQLPTAVSNNTIAVITTTMINNSYIDTREPITPINGDIWVKQSNVDSLINLGADTKQLNIRLSTVKQYINNRWVNLDGYVGISGVWVQISKAVMLYGFKIDKNNSDPMTRVSYTNDCIGFEPARMDFETGTFMWGSWKDFIEELATPVMLNFNGTEGYELDRNNQRKKADGTPSDIANESYNGNAMVRIKCIWVKRWEDSNFNYINLSFERPDNSYVAYAFTNQNQIVQDQVYIPMFRGSLDSNGKLRSLADKTPWATTGGVEPEITAVNKNGAGWYTNYKSMHDLKIDLIKLITCSTDDQTALGQGNTSGNSTPLTAGTLSTFGAFYGYSDTKHQVKCFYSEVMWGDRYERMMGMCMTGSVARGKNFPPYNSAGTGYTQLGNLKIGEEYYGYVKNMNTSADGYFPTAYGASSNTYYCDYIYATTGSSEYYAVDCGYDGDGSRCGSCCLDCSGSVTTSSSGVGASPYYIKP